MNRRTGEKANTVAEGSGNSRRQVSGLASRRQTRPKFLELYRLIAGAAWPFLILYYLLGAPARRKYRSNCLYRMGLRLPKRLPPGERIWFHALSVGEILSVVPLVREVRRLCPHLEVVFSTATEAGHEIAGKRLAGEIDYLLYLPHDFPYITDRFVQCLDPSLFVLVETDIWPILLDSLRRRNIFTTLVNARLSPRSAGRFRALSRFFSPFSFFDLIFPQSGQDQERFVTLGTASRQIQEPGNLKFDALPAPVSTEERKELRAAAGIATGRPVWIAGSTHPGEEAILLRVHQKLRTVYRDLLLIIAPRQVGRSGEIIALISKSGLTTTARSWGASAGNWDVYLLDTLGELEKFYAVADAAFIGGSLVPFGGHNPLEAMAQRKPCVWGPHMFNFRELEARLLAAGCATQVTSEAQLLSTLDDRLGSAALRKEAEQHAERFLSANTGCAHRIAQVLCAKMNCTGRRED